MSSMNQLAEMIGEYDAGLTIQKTNNDWRVYKIYGNFIANE